MNFLQWLKGVFYKMIGRESIEQALKVTPVVSNVMQKAIELWEQMYTGESPWLSENIHSLGLASLIASEKARMATLEMQVKITGEGEYVDFVKDSFSQVTDCIREKLEYGIALGGMVIKPYVVMGPDKKYKIKFNFVNATNFYPLSFSADGVMTSAAFVDRIITGDKIYSKFEIHTLENNTVTISNRAFVIKNDSSTITSQNTLGQEILLSSVPEWANIPPVTTIDSTDTLLFAYFKNPDANIVDMSSPLGVSGFARATDLIKQADEQYSNLLWEFEGGQLAIDVDRTALNPIKNARGEENFVLPKLQDRLYRRNLDLGEDDMYNVFSPDLRDVSIINGLNNILIRIEDACALARGTISDIAISEARTATELKILKQRAFSANADVQKELERTFTKVFKIMDIYCQLYKILDIGKYEVSYHWDDSILVDKDAERQQDLLDVDKGLMSKVEYRMKWMGETETQAKLALKQIQEEAMANVEIQRALMGQPANGEEPEPTNKQKDHDKRKRANESKETNTPDEE
jgi:A118 family predicted phage portal protein